MDTQRVQEFLLLARTKTYASGSNKVQPSLPGAVQYEYTQGEWKYIDIYNIGNRIFAGLETVYHANTPVLTMSYFGNFTKLSEEETDAILRKALITHAQTARLFSHIEWTKDIYTYICNANTQGSINEFSGNEKIYKDKEVVYYLFYAGGLIG